LEKKSKQYKSRLEMLIERFELAAFLNTPVRKLSLGERMRAEIAASLLHRPRLLLLDEPTIGIDVVARQRLRELLAQWNREEGLTVFLTSHDTGDIEAVADRVILINHGRVIIDDTIDGVRHYGAPKSADTGEPPDMQTLPALEKVLSDLFTAK
ncbi:MAG TPA: ATP-binding cassette domain-containing protein, partial [Methanothrix soehngenii]|nr:ATP-binding cassette domain-containing protein [Methanothrix soehngenii]